MRTITDATLYTVTGPRTTYYALRNHDTGAIQTERTEAAAAAIANEQDFVIVDQVQITHGKLLEMMAARSEGNEALDHDEHAMSDAPAAHGSGLAALARRLLHRGEPHTPAHL